jgi:hypothetical protein
LTTTTITGLIVARGHWRNGADDCGSGPKANGDFASCEGTGTARYASAAEQSERGACEEGSGGTDAGDSGTYDQEPLLTECLH